MSSVKVAVRVRPFNEREKGSKCCVQMVSKPIHPPMLCIYLEWSNYDNIRPKHRRREALYI